jgi:hypothetical protein
MERRYGYGSEEAVGKVAHKLLQTNSWQTLDEIEAILVKRSVWRGGLMHYRADGKAVIASNHWHLHDQPQGRTPLVTELHSDIVPAGTPTSGDLADILAAMTRQLSEPLTAASAYVSAAQRDLQPSWPDRMRASQAMDRAARQLARARETLSRIRVLGAGLKECRQAEVYSSVTATTHQPGTTPQEVHARAMVEPREGVRSSQPGPSGEPSLEHATVLLNIQLFQRLLQQDGSVELDIRTKQTVTQLLIEEKAKLTAFEGR